MLYWKLILSEEYGGLVMETVTGIEHPPIGTVKEEGNVIVIGMLFTTTAYSLSTL